MAISAYEKVSFEVSLLAAADYTTKQFLAVKQSSSGIATVCSTAGERAIGILQDAPLAGAAGLVAVSGISRAYIGGTVAADADLAVATTGRLVAATTGDYVVGRAMSSGVSGDIIPVLLNSTGNKFV
jgi:hypothetical protein